MEVLGLRFSINAISACPDEPLAVCGGRDILKIISIGEVLEERRNLRQGRAKLMYSTQDLAWSPLHKDYIISASKNSYILLWNLSRADTKLEQTYREHTTLVNKVNWHPNYADIFASAGQDGLIKIWDKREPTPKMTMHGNADGARDVSFSPFQPNVLASSYDSGFIQIWDMRKASECEARFTAHLRSALSLSWHPRSSRILVSGGGDRTMKIWNLESNESMRKIQAPESVFRVRWDVESTKQIASISHIHDTNMYIWNYEDSSLPKAVFKGHREIVTDFLILEDSVITCSTDGKVIRQPRSNAYQPYEYLPRATVTVSPLNMAATSVVSDQKKTALKFYNLGDIRSQADTVSRDYKLQPDNLAASCSVNAKVSEKHAGLWKSVNSLYKMKQNTEFSWIKDIVEDSFQNCVEYYSEIGDIQTAASLSSALGIPGPITEYEQFLRQLGLNINAAKLGLPHPSIEIGTKCRCGKDTDDHNEGRCPNLAFCGVCAAPVRGLHSWCQGCGHGGHLMHMQQWFEQNSKCPVGCGHTCIT